MRLMSFQVAHWTYQDGRKDYGETRIITIGHLRGRMMVIVWTPRGDSRHILHEES